MGNGKYLICAVTMPVLIGLTMTSWLTHRHSQMDNLIYQPVVIRNNVIAKDIAPVKTNTAKPSTKPTTNPTKKPTFGPSKKPTMKPTVKPTLSPTRKPSYHPTLAPTKILSHKNQTNSTGYNLNQTMTQITHLNSTSSPSIASNLTLLTPNATLDVPNIVNATLIHSNGTS